MLATLRLPAISPDEEVADRPFIIHNLLHLIIITAPLQLISKLLGPLIDQILRAHVPVKDTEVRRADAKHMRHEIGLPLRNPINRCTAPVVTAEDDRAHAELLADALDGVGVRFEPKVPQVVRGARVAVAHAVESQTAEAEILEERDLVAPGEGAVRKAVDQYRSALGVRGLGREVEVGWRSVLVECSCC